MLDSRPVYLDPDTPSGLNLYAYCNNDPVNYSDPSGNFAVSLAIAGLIVGAVIGATIGGIAAYNAAKDSGSEGWELFGWTALGILGGGAVGSDLPDSGSRRKGCCSFWGLGNNRCIDLMIYFLLKEIFMALISDDMKKESKVFLILLILGYAYTLSLIVSYGNSNDWLKWYFYFFGMSSLMLYCWLYTIKYKIVVTSEKIHITTLFKTTTINVEELTNYNCKRYGKSVFYQFDLFTKDKHILITTRYKDELEKILIENIPVK